MDKFTDEIISLAGKFKPKYKSSDKIEIDCPGCGKKGKGVIFIKDGEGFNYSCRVGSCRFNETVVWRAVWRKLYDSNAELLSYMGGNPSSYQPDKDWKPNIEKIERAKKERKRLESIVYTEFEPKLPGCYEYLFAEMWRDVKAKRVADFLLDKCAKFANHDRDFFWLPSQPDFYYLGYYHNGELVGMHGKSIDREYCKSVGKMEFDGSYLPDKMMYGQDKIFDESRDYLLVIESPRDALLFDGVSPQTANLSTHHVNLLKKAKMPVILCPDSDKTSQFIRVAMDNNFLISYATGGGKWKDCGEAAEHLGYDATLDILLDNATFVTGGDNA